MVLREPDPRKRIDERKKKIESKETSAGYNMSQVRSKQGSIADAAETMANPDPRMGVRTRSGTISARSTVPVLEEGTSENSATTSEGTTATSSGTERTTSTEETSATEETLKDAEDTRQNKRAPRQSTVKSHGNDKISRLEAEEKIAELKLQEVRAALALAQAKLARRLAVERDDEVEDEQTSRVEEWLEGQGQTLTNQGKSNEKIEEKSGNEQPRSQNVEVTSLAAALTQAVRMSRDAPRFLQELPVFGGHSTGWLAYRAAYYETEKMFSTSENIARLRRSLKGAALEAVNSLLISQPEPRAVMQALERRFGRPDTLAMNEIQKIKALGKISDNPRDLCVFANKVANIVATIEALKKIHYLFNPELVKNIVEKLTPILRNKWYDYAASNKEDIPDLKKITAFLNEEADKCGAYAQPEDMTGEFQQDRGQRKRFERTYSVEVGKRNQCPTCKQDHYLPDCKRFTNAQVSDRWEIAKKHRLCYQCLRGTHRRGNCNAKKCGLEGCSMAHHRLLHHKRPPTTPPAAEPPRQETRHEETVEVVNNANCLKSRQAFLKIAPVSIMGDNNTRVDTYALLDDGSTVTLIDEGLADLLELDGPRDNMWVQGLNETVKHENSKRVDFRIRGRYDGREYVTRNARTVQKLMFTNQHVHKKDLQDCPHLKDIEDQLVYQNARPRILIGQDNWELLVATEIRKGKKNQPVASHTRLGWVLHGYRSSYDNPVAFCGHTVATNEEKEKGSVETMMKRFFDLEALGVEARKQKNDPEERALKILEQNSKRTPDGRFETSLLWKNENEEIPNNYNDALKRLKSLEKKLDRDVELKKKYHERIEELMKSGYAAPATKPPVPGRTWYLPHFAVYNPSKPKIRLVHDAAARSHGRSLNDMLLSGPDLLQSLPGVIMRFRTNPIAVTADIKEMFMRIKIRSEDRDALRFLWRGEDREKKPQEYQMMSLIFGATSSPCTALYIKDRNAEEFAEKYPKAVVEIKKNHYMDDYITSFADKEEALEVSKNVDFIHRHAGFELRTWSSNEESLRRHFNGNDETSVVSIGEAGVEKTLGILWEVKEDKLSFNLNETKMPLSMMNNEYIPTKREALSVIMSLFDPLGLLSPVTMPAKRFMQETWRHGTGWDEPIPEQLVPRWRTWMKNLQGVKTVKIPRCYNIQPAIEKREMHTFVDASEEAYATAVYLRMIHYDGSVRTALIAAKSRVAPLKPTSIPRLELQAALLGARLARTVEKEHEHEFARKIYWSDSRTVLAWIRAEPRAYKTFVAHRLAEIEELTKVNEWRWIPTRENVADDATRETPIDFGATHRWFHGPEFLKQSENCWPTEERTIEKIQTGEEKCCVIHDFTTDDGLPDINRIEKWRTLIRATGRVLQFIDLCRKRKYAVAATRKRTKKNEESDETWGPTTRKTTNNKTRKPCINTHRMNIITLEAEYLIRAEKIWLRKVQRECYPEEMKRLCEHKAPAAGDRLASLSVFIEDGLIKLKGRIGAATDVNEETNNPVILDGGHGYTKKYIQHVHVEMHHGGVEITVNELRQRFWITRIRPTVKGVIRRCQACRIRKAKPMSPATGDLPPARLTHHARPFSFTGLDYFGPIEVTVGRHREKRWVALFTCLTTRAIHLEVVTSLSASSAIAALRRFSARRGQPTELWTDNATCFKAAEKELKEAWDDFKNEVNARHIVWRYIPPGAPFMGGAWERLVRSVKETLRVTLHEKHPSDETLYTLLVEAENIINSRPLTHVTVEPGEPEALTPNHILLGPNSHVSAPGRFSEENTATRQLWKRAQHLADEFWRRWVKEYLPLLQHRREPHSKGSVPEIGDVVIICDSNLPRNVWPKGRVKAIYPGKDNVVRVVDVETSNGHVLRRPCKKIVVLPGLSPS